ncbi:hypothetical protein [Aureimonas frigidaquae]|uniref:hypothetical protein n=1 Tax=Aureimonas frigidaquae TaxID=424757 RepID=UPI0007842E49|nr:hypothetical protein [Aureimonas frigidaquae]
MTDGALSVLTFAAYHQLASGERVRDVVLRDGAGHSADAGGVEVLREAGLLTVEGDRGRLTQAGEEALDRLVEAIRAAA